jgi:hypothetical protein
MNFKQKLIAITVPAVLALGLGAAAVQAATPKASQPRVEQGPTKGVAPETDNQNEANDVNEAADPAEAPEAPGTAGSQSGHQDAAGDQNHEFDGQE